MPPPDALIPSVHFPDASSAAAAAAAAARLDSLRARKGPTNMVTEQRYPERLLPDWGLHASLYIRARSTRRHRDASFSARMQHLARLGGLRRRVGYFEIPALSIQTPRPISVS